MEVPLLRSLAAVTIAMVLTATLFMGVGLVNPDEAEALTARQRVLRLTNRSRVNNGLPKLRLNKKVSRMARSHSSRMAQRKTLFHSTDLRSRLSAWSPSSWGENVGCGRRLWKIHSMFMRSSAHRANILSRQFRRVGVGVVRAPGGGGMCGSGPRFWVTQIFYG
jgi:uncharacterized protein YkwD